MHFWVAHTQTIFFLHQNAWPHMDALFHFSCCVVFILHSFKSLGLPQLTHPENKFGFERLSSIP